MIPDHHDTAHHLMERFPGWKIWPGPTTRTWWAMAPRHLRLPYLLEAVTTDALTDQIVQHQPATRRPVAMTRPSWRLDEHPYPVRLARRVLDDTLTAWNAHQWADNGRIVASELVTNATGHGDPPIFLTLAMEKNPPLGPESLAIEVTDTSPLPPREREPGDEGGYGLAVLHGLAQITVHLHPGGKTVRAVLPTTHNG